MHACMHAHRHTYIQGRTSAKCVTKAKPTYIHTYMHAYIHPYIHTQIQQRTSAKCATSAKPTCIHAYMHTYTHTHTNPAADERKMRDERETNEMELRRKAGDALVYGSIVQLKHKSSYKFVTQTKNRAEHDHLAMEVKLVKYGGEGSWWRVLSGDRVRMEGERLQYGDRLVFVNVKYSHSVLGIMKEPIVHEDGEQSVFIRLHATVSARYEVNSSAVGSRFQVMCACMYVCMYLSYVRRVYVCMYVCDH